MLRRRDRPPALARHLSTKVIFKTTVCKSYGFSLAYIEDSLIRVTRRAVSGPHSPSAGRCFSRHPSRAPREHGSHPFELQNTQGVCSLASRRTELSCGIGELCLPCIRLPFSKQPTVSYAQEITFLPPGEDCSSPNVLTFVSHRLDSGRNKIEHTAEQQDSSATFRVDGLGSLSALHGPHQGCLVALNSKRTE